jgi:hypothetical protein
MLGPGAIETIVWVCLAFSVLSADIVLQWQDLIGSRRVPAVTKTPLPVAAVASEA